MSAGTSTPDFAGYSGGFPPAGTGFGIVDWSFVPCGVAAAVPAAQAAPVLYPGKRERRKERRKKVPRAPAWAAEEDDVLALALWEF